MKNKFTELIKKVFDFIRQLLIKIKLIIEKKYKPSRSDVPTDFNKPEDLTPHTSHFKLYEFHSHDGVVVPQKYYENVQDLMDRLEILRSKLGNNPVTIISGYRSYAHNKKVGGVVKSQHLIGKAADIRVLNLSTQKIYQAANKVFNNGGVGIYPKSKFIHVDIRKERARWSKD